MHPWGWYTPGARALTPQDLNRRRCYWRHIGAGGGWKSRTVEGEVAGRVRLSFWRRHRLEISPHRPPLSIFGPYSGVLGAAFQPHTSRGWYRLPKGAGVSSGAPEARRKARTDGGGGRSLSRGDLRLRRRKSPRRRGWRELLTPPLPLPPVPAGTTVPAAEAAAAAIPTGAPPLAFLLLSPSVRLFRDPALLPLPSSSPPVTPPYPTRGGDLGCPGHGVRSHSEKDSGFRPAAEPGVPEAETMYAIVGAHLGCCLPVFRGRGHRRLLFGRRRLAAEVSPNGTVTLRWRLLPPHHRWDSAPRLRGWAREPGLPGRGMRPQRWGRRTGPRCRRSSSSGLGDTIERFRCEGAGVARWGG